jgi:exosortase A-associated hydrolase 1
MGDSAGERSGATAAADIGAALDAFQATVPGLEEIVLWGLSSAGTLAACYAPRDQRVRGVVMVNPWTEAARGRAAAHLRHYYVTRLASRALWRRACTGRVDFGRSLRGLARTIAACGRGPAADAAPPIGGVADGEFTLMPSELLASLQAFSGRSLLILCGGDEEALVFRSNVVATAAWRRLEARALATRRELPEANHTFSRRDWRDQVARWTGEWLRTW